MQGTPRLEHVVVSREIAVQGLGGFRVFNLFMLLAFWIFEGEESLFGRGH